MSESISKVVVKSYLEGYPVEGVSYSWITKLYIKSKRKNILSLMLNLIRSKL